MIGRSDENEGNSGGVDIDYRDRNIRAAVDEVRRRHNKENPFPPRGKRLIQEEGNRKCGDHGKYECADHSEESKGKAPGVGPAEITV